MYEFPTNAQPLFPTTRLLQGQDGNFYGTTAGGGRNNNDWSDNSKGTIYRLTPGGSFTLLYSFAGTNGANPSGDLIQATNGILYGTTTYGTNPPFDSGTFFKVTTNGLLTTLFFFGGTNGSNPYGQLAPVTNGFYGTTRNGGSNGLGTVFKITTNGTFTLLHSFDGTNDGCYPFSGLTLANDGNFYGMTSSGGNGFTDFSGNGTVFKMGTNGIFASLVSFDTNYVGSFKSRFTLGTDGQLYGVAGKQIFKMTTNGVLTPLAAFNGTNGNRSARGLTLGKDGNFYGITPYHLDGATLTYGTIYKMTPSGELKTIFYFNGTNALNPFGTFTLAKDGNLYGAVSDEPRNVTLDGNAGAIFCMVEPSNLAAIRLTGSIKLTWTTFTNGIYRLEKLSSLGVTNWTTISSNIIATTTNASFTNATTGATQEFYRAVLLP